MVNQVTAGGATTMSSSNGSRDNGWAGQWGAGMQGKEGEILPPMLSQGNGGGGVSMTSTPALGLAWGYCVNSRIYLRRAASRSSSTTSTAVVETEEEGIATSGANTTTGSTPSLRSLTVLLSPLRPPTSLLYRITAQGVQSVQ